MLDAAELENPKRVRRRDDPANIVNQIRKHIAYGGSPARYWDKASRTARILWRVFAHLPEESTDLCTGLVSETARIGWESLDDEAHVKLGIALHMSAILIHELSAQTKE